MSPFLRHLIGWIIGFFRSRQDLILENLALCQQLLALKTNRPRRPLSTMHKFFWIALLRFWSGWKQSLMLVTPRTVVGWYRAGFRLYWRWLSRARRRFGGRMRVNQEIRALIFSHGRGESNLGSTPDSRRSDQVGIPCLGTDGFTLASASPESSRSRPTLADVLAELSQGY